MNRPQVKHAFDVVDRASRTQLLSCVVSPENSIDIELRIYLMRNLQVLWHIRS